jgi:hypothetical protein
MLANAMVTWMRYHFSDASRIGITQIRNRIWTSVTDRPSQQAPNSPINIGLVEEWSPADGGRRPAILVRDDDWQVQPFSIDARLQGTVPFDGVDSFVSFWTGTLTLFGISPLPQEAKLLRREVMIELVENASIIRQEFSLQRFVVVGAGKLFRVKEARDHYASPVTVGFAIEHDWSLVTQAPYLKSVGYEP